MAALFHVENKINPHDVADVMKEAKLEFASTLANVIRARLNYDSASMTKIEIIDLIRTLLGGYPI